MQPRRHNYSLVKYLHRELKPRMTVPKSPLLLGRVPSPIPCASLVHLQEILNLPALCSIADVEIEHETGGYHSYAKLKCQVDRSSLVETWGVRENPGGYNAADVNRDRAECDRRRAAVMWLYVV